MQDSTFLAFIIYVLSRIVKHSNLTIFLEQPFEPFPEGNDPGPGQKVVDQQSATSMAVMAVLMVRQPTWSRKSLRGNAGIGLYPPLDS